MTHPLVENRSKLWSILDAATDELPYIEVGQEKSFLYDLIDELYSCVTEIEYYEDSSGYDPDKAAFGG